MGLHREFHGTILLDGEDIRRLPAWARSGRGLAMVPEGRRVFPDLTVEENLAIGVYSRTDRQRIEKSMKDLYAVFPILDQRRRQVSKTLRGYVLKTGRISVEGSSEELKSNPEVQRAYQGI